MTKNEEVPGVIRKLDEVVVNRIAAGEVIQRPANALKEMLENSLDAGSTQITVTVKGGGLKILQIQDNGTGIRKEDMSIVAERFTTSKLKEFSDLTSISTYGFRGEALASISHVAHLSILTKTRHSPCGYKCEYKDSVPLTDPKPLAANQGTTITVEDLFYNVPTRRAALRSNAEEHNKIADVITKYAIHNSGVGFALKKMGEAGVDVKTVATNTVVDNIRTIYGPTVAKELIEFKMEDEKLKFNSSGYISNVNYNVKKMVFLLFINNRLVDSTAIKRAIEHVYASYLPKGSYPFIYMSLNIAPQNVDVNVHPTKHEVFFLHQDSIIERIQQGLEEKLLNSNCSRTFYTQKLLPGAGVTLEMFENKEKAQAAKDMVRTDSNMQKMDKFLAKKESNLEASKHDEAMDVSDTEPIKSSAKQPGGRQISLSSVKELRQSILSEGSPEANTITSGLAFVGCVDRELALVQYSTKLYLVNTTRITRLLFRQIILQDFGNLSVLRLTPPPKVKDLALLALEQEEAGWSPEDGDKEDLAGHVVDMLAGKRDMLADYFSLEFEMIGDSLHLTGLPLLLEDFCPWFGGLPLFIIRLATEVDWDTEKSCFDSFAKETAAFYSVREKKGLQPRFDTGQHGGENVDWRHTVEHVVYPAVKKILVTPAACLTDKTLLQVANLPDLYKVFERC